MPRFFPLPSCCARWATLFAFLALSVSSVAGASVNAAIDDTNGGNMYTLEDTISHTVLAVSATPSPGDTKQKKTNGVVVALAILTTLFVVGLLATGGFCLWRRRYRRRMQPAKIDASFAIEEAAPPPPPLSEMRKLSSPSRPSLGIITTQEDLRVAALKRGASTMTRSSVSNPLMSPALASSVMEYAPYGAPARVIRNPSVATNGPPRKNRANRASRIRSLVYGPSTAATEQSIAELQEEMLMPEPPIGGTRNLPAPPAVPVKEDKPMRVVRASDLPPVPPLPTAAADLVGSSSTLPPAPGVSTTTSVAAAGRSRRLPVPPGASSSGSGPAGPSY